jgi:tetratricopeptide (TPR) repeat protein
MSKRKKPAPPKAPSMDFLQEKDAMLKAVSQFLEEQNFNSPEEANQFLEQFVGMHMKDVTQALTPGRKADAGERANALFFQAMEARSEAAARRKLQEVLKLDPDHVRARITLALMETSPDKIEKLLREAVAAGERQLGSLLKEECGQLWGWHEARPYMEARAELARLLALQESRIDEAIVEHQELLRLNENDNQGIRDPLLGLLMEAGRFEEARTLVKRYDTEFAATWLYAKAFLAFDKHARKAGWGPAQSDHDHDWLEQQMRQMASGVRPEIPAEVHKADKLLIKALKFNPWCAIYILKCGFYLQQEPPESYSPGSPEEARLFLDFQLTAWTSHPASLLWLMCVGLPWLIQNGFEEEAAP